MRRSDGHNSTDHIRTGGAECCSRYESSHAVGDDGDTLAPCVCLHGTQLMYHRCRVPFNVSQWRLKVYAAHRANSGTPQTPQQWTPDGSIAGDTVNQQHGPQLGFVTRILDLASARREAHREGREVEPDGFR
jgi:hypothetical protein